MSLQHCNLCELPSSYKTVYKDDQLTLIKCNNCGLVFDADANQDEEARESSVGVHSDINFYFGRKNELVLEKEVNRISKVISPEGKKILDFGCGVGILLEQAKTAGYNIYGVELNHAAFSYVKDKNLFPIYKTIDAMIKETGESYFDVAVLSHVLEHVSNPAKVLDDIYKVLRPGGLIVVICPAFNPITRLLEKARSITNWGVIVKGHQYYFIRKTFKKYFKKTGFTEINIVPSITGGILMRAIDQYKSLFLRRSVLGILKAIFNIIHILGIDINITCYARKPKNVSRKI